MDNTESQGLNKTKFVPFFDIFCISKNGFILLLLCLVPLALYWQTINFELVWDDFDHTIKNPYLNPVNFENLSHFWTEIYWGLYIPVTYTLWGGLMKLSLLVGLNPENPVLLHLINILLHVFNGFLVFTLLQQFIKNRWYATIGTLFFLLHPIQVETVAWASEFRGLLSFTFGFLALYQYIKSCYFIYEKANTKLAKRYYFYGWMLFLAAMLSKPSILVILFFAPILEYFLYHTSLKNLIVRILPYMIPVLAIIIVTTSAQGELGAKQPYPLWIRPFVYSDNLLFYLKKIFIPIDFSASYARTTRYLALHWWFYTSLIILFGIGGILFKHRKKYESVFIGLILFTLGFLTVSGLLKFDFQAWSNVADRYIYISMFGIAFMLAALLEQVTFFNKKIIFLLSTIWLLILIYRSSIQIPVWKDSVSLWSHTIKITPQESKAWNNLGSYYTSKKEYKKALADYQKATEINPFYSFAYNNIGRTYYEIKDFNKAIFNFNKAISLNQDGKFISNRAKAYSQMKEYDKALKDFNLAIELGEKSPQLYNNLGCTHSLINDYEQAVADFNESLILDPKNVNAYYNRGNAYLNLGNYNLALKDYQKALDLDPEYELAINALKLFSKLK